MENTVYICVDFDGTIVDHCYPDIGVPVPGAIEWMRRWVDGGAKIILYTMRADGNSAGPVLTEAVDYLRECGVELYGINRNPDQDEWSASPKAYGQIYVDDSAFGCPMIHPGGFNQPCVDWSKVGPQVEKALRSNQKLRDTGGVGGRLKKLFSK